VTTDPVHTDPIHSALAEFVAAARWFGGKGRSFAVSGVRRIGSLGVPPSEGAPVLVHDLVTLAYADDPDGDEYYQLPLALYA
jgi:maltokinase